MILEFLQLFIWMERRKHIVFSAFIADSWSLGHITITDLFTGNYFVGLVENRLELEGIGTNLVSWRTNFAHKFLMENIIELDIAESQIVDFLGSIFVEDQLGVTGQERHV